MTKQQGSSIHWQNIVHSLDQTNEVLSENYVSIMLDSVFFPLLDGNESKRVSDVNKSTSGFFDTQKESFQPGVLIHKCSAFQQVSTASKFSTQRKDQS